MLDFKKPLQTADGKLVKLYSMEGVAPYVVHGAILLSDGWYAMSWTIDGYVYDSVRENDRNLVNVHELAFDKPVQTKHGKQARIYATDGAGDYPVHGAILSEHGWYPCSWSRNGYVDSRKADLRYDLVNLPECAT